MRAIGSCAAHHFPVICFDLQKGRSSVAEQRPFKSLPPRRNTGVFRGFKNLATYGCRPFPAIPHGSIQERCKSMAGILGDARYSGERVGLPVFSTKTDEIYMLTPDCGGIALHARHFPFERI